MDLILVKGVYFALDILNSIKLSLFEGKHMYMDSVILFSLVTVGAIVGMMVYVYRYMYRHIKLDERLHEKENHNTEAKQL